MSKIFVFDTETTNLIPKKGPGIDNYYEYTNLHKYDQCRMVSICWKLFTEDGECLSTKYYVIKPRDFIIDNNSEATKIHNITQEIASNGVDIDIAINALQEDIEDVKLIVAHNIAFDTRILCSELHRYNYTDLCQVINGLPTYCTCRKGEMITKIQLPGWRRYKIPKLCELYKFLFDEEHINAHNAESDTNACAKCYFKMITL